MGFQCAPQVIGLVRGEPKNPRHRAEGGKILREMGDERYSRTKHLDRSLSDQNVYGWHSSGQAYWDALCDIADEGTTYVTAGGQVRTRKVRRDAPIGWAVVIHPLDEITSGWSWDKFRRFDRDAMQCLAEIEPRLFGGYVDRDGSDEQESLYMDAEHHDEKGKHAHHAGIARDSEGKWCGNLVDAALMIRINEEFPRLMRAKGWDVDDMDVTDWSRARDDEEYRQHRNAKRHSQRKTVNEYSEDESIVRATRAANTALQAEEAAIAALRQRQAAEQELSAVEEETERLRAESEGLESRLVERSRSLARERAQLLEERAQLVAEKAKTRTQAEAYRQAKDDYEFDLAALHNSDVVTNILNAVLSVCQKMLPVRLYESIRDVFSRQKFVDSVRVEVEEPHETKEQKQASDYYEKMLLSQLLNEQSSKAKTDDYELY